MPRPDADARIRRLEERIRRSFARFQWLINRHRELVGADLRSAERLRDLGVTDHLVVPLEQPALFEGARLFANRDLLLAFAASLAGEETVCVEVGTYQGKFADVILRTFDPGELHLFDLNFDGVPETSQLRASSAVHFHVGNSSRMLKRVLGRESVDFGYVDANHSYTGVKRDIAAIYDRMKPGGLIQFNDYTRWSVQEMVPYGVQTAVNELINERSCPVLGFGLSELGYHDILLRKP